MSRTRTNTPSASNCPLAGLCHDGGPMFPVSQDNIFLVPTAPSFFSHLARHQMLLALLQGTSSSDTFHHLLCYHVVQATSPVTWITAVSPGWAPAPALHAVLSTQQPVTFLRFHVFALACSQPSELPDSPETHPPTSLTCLSPASPPASLLCPLGFTYWPPRHPERAQ